MHPPLVVKVATGVLHRMNPPCLVSMLIPPGGQRRHPERRDHRAHATGFGRRSLCRAGPLFGQMRPLPRSGGPDIQSDLGDGSPPRTLSPPKTPQTGTKAKRPGHQTWSQPNPRRISYRRRPPPGCRSRSRQPFASRPRSDESAPEPLCHRAWRCPGSATSNHWHR